MQKDLKIGDWSIDKRLSLGTLWALIVQGVFVVWFMSAQTSTLEHTRTQQSLVNSQTAERLTQTEQNVQRLSTTLNAELRIIQQDRSETNGRLVRIETLLTQILDRQDSLLRTSTNGENSSVRTN